MPNGETRLRQFFGSGSQAAAEFSSEYEKGKAIHAALVTQTNQTSDSETPRSIFDQTVEGFGFGVKKLPLQLTHLRKRGRDSLGQSKLRLPCIRSPTRH